LPDVDGTNIKNIPDPPSIVQSTADRQSKLERLPGNNYLVALFNAES